MFIFNHKVYIIFFLTNTIFGDEKIINNLTEYEPYCDCKKAGFGIVQKISYHVEDSGFHPVDISLISSCVKCGLCLAVADKINTTLMESHDSVISSVHHQWPVEKKKKKAETFFDSICNVAFKRYRLREIGGQLYIGDSLPDSVLVESTADGLWETKLRDKCRKIVDTIGTDRIYNRWHEWWCNQSDKNLESIMCNGEFEILHDCKGVEKTSRIYSQTSCAFNAIFNCP